MTIVLEQATPTARKAHQCDTCGGPIAPGEEYRRERSIYDGEPMTYKCHLLCDYLYWLAWREEGLSGDEQPDFDEGVLPYMREFFAGAFLFAAGVEGDPVTTDNDGSPSESGDA